MKSPTFPMREALEKDICHAKRLFKAALLESQ
jgi:hypothetical protein